VTNFVRDLTAVPNGKSDLRPVGSPTSKYLSAAEWNTVMQHLLDIRAELFSARYLGLEGGSTAPGSPGNVVMRGGVSGASLEVSTNNSAFRSVLPSFSPYSWTGVPTVTETFAVKESDRALLIESTDAASSINSTPSLDVAGSKHPGPVTIFNVGNHNITFRDENDLAGTDLVLRSPKVMLAPGESLTVLFSQDLAKWYEVSRSNNPPADSTGTPGNATQHTYAGRVAVDTGTDSVVVTNSRVTTTSIIHATIQTVDATLTQILTVVPSAGSFEITGNANATGDVNVCWSLVS
jgi:hypothetical protein